MDLEWYNLSESSFGRTERFKLDPDKVHLKSYVQAGGMAEPVKRLPCKHEDLNSNS